MNNANFMNVNDTEQTYLWHLIESTRTHHEHLVRIRPEVKEQLDRHKKQITELYSEIRRTLDNYHKWTSGKNLIPIFIDLIIILEEYRASLFDRQPGRRAPICGLFRAKREVFTNLIQTLSGLFNQ